jgi:hypothetical protein
MKSITLLMLMLLASSQVLDETQAVKSGLESLAISKPMTYRNLTIFPITRSLAPMTEYLTLDEAVKKDWLTIREIGSGEVNFVELKNAGGKPVLIMTGEMINGAKQDRMLKDDVLIPPKSEWLRVPVYCVEHGRWVIVSPAFKSAGLVVPNALRQRARITEKQSAVWDEIAQSQDRLGIVSSTGTAMANYEDEDMRKEIAEYTERFNDIPKLAKNTVGVCVTTGSRVICVDIFANNTLLMKYWNKLLKSYIMDAIHETKSTIHMDEVRRLLNAVTHAQYISIGTPGLGNLFKIETDFGKGSALTHQKNLVHMDFFPDEVFADPEWRLDVRRDERLND